MNYGIPYMGSKSKIVKSIALNFPKAEHFYDLFGGDFCVTDYMLRHKSHRYRHFHYNEINADIVQLVKRAIAGEFNYDVFKPAWVSREDFSRLKDSDPYVRCVWSFGNNQKSYLFGDCEAEKKSMHMAVVFDEFDDKMLRLFKMNAWPASCKSIKDRRLYLREKIREVKRIDLQQLQQLERLERLQRLQQLERLERLQRLQRLQQLERLQRLQRLQQLERLQRLQQLEQLQRLQRLERLQRLHFYALDYRDVPIKENSVVYCDIPYKGTAEYRSSFNHKDFYDWAATRPFPVFISEYSLDDPRFKCVYTIDKRSMLSADKTVVNKEEKLFWNGI